VKTTDIVQTAGDNKARRLLTIDLLVKIAVEKGVLDIKMVNGP
jgi:hypothetical protein